MSLEQASTFLSGSILFIFGLTGLIIGIVVINNILHKFWKPVTIFTRDSFSIFGGHHPHDPMQNLSQEEYDRLVDHLEKMRLEKSAVDKKSV